MRNAVTTLTGWPMCPDCERQLTWCRVCRFNSIGERTDTPKARCTNSACASWRRWFAVQVRPMTVYAPFEPAGLDDEGVRPLTDADRRAMGDGEP